ALAGWWALTRPFWGAHSGPPGAIRALEDPAQAWYGQNSRGYDPAHARDIGNAAFWAVVLAQASPFPSPALLTQSSDVANQESDRQVELLAQARTAHNLLRRAGACCEIRDYIVWVSGQCYDPPTGGPVEVNDDEHALLQQLLMLPVMKTHTLTRAV